MKFYGPLVIEGNIMLLQSVEIGAVPIRSTEYGVLYVK